MFASTNVLTASPVLRPVPSVWTVNVVAGVPIDSVADAWPVTLPAGRRGEGDRALAGGVGVRARRRCSVPVGAVCTAPFVSVSVTVTCSLAAGDEDARAGVLEQGHGEGVRLVDLVGRARRDRDPGVDPGLVRRARVRARCRSCARVSESPPTMTLVCALTTVDAGGRRAERDRAAAGAARGGARVRRGEAAGAAVDREADLRAVGRVLEAAPVPLFTLTCAVNVCAWPTRFVAVGGVIWMFASTYVLTASAELRPMPSVCDRDRRRRRGPTSERRGRVAGDLARASPR